MATQSATEQAAKEIFGKGEKEPTQAELLAEIKKLETQLKAKAKPTAEEKGFLASCKAKLKAGIDWTLEAAANHPYLATALIFASGMAVGAYAGYSSGIRSARVNEAFAKAGFTPME